MLATRENLEHAIPYQILVGLISAIGGVGILRFWLSRSGVSVGEALTFALMLAPPMTAIQIMTGLLTAAGAFIRIRPACYLRGRFAVGGPLVGERSGQHALRCFGDGGAPAIDTGMRI